MVQVLSISPFIHVGIFPFLVSLFLASLHFFCLQYFFLFCLFVEFFLISVEVSYMSTYYL